jgi:hypothetical protein
LYLTFALDTCVSFIVPVRVMYSRPARRTLGSRFDHLVGFEFVVARQPDVHRVVEILLEASAARISVQ